MSKRKLLLIPAMVCVFLISTPNKAQSSDFTCTTTAYGASITGYTGSGGAVTTPALCGGKPVFSIADNAFAGKTLITSITITSATSIGKNAFQDCTGLTSVILPSDLETIGDYAFSDCTSLLSITIPPSVTTIGACAFIICTGLTSVSFSEGLTGIGHDAFFGCDKLSCINIPASVTSIGVNAFGNCKSMTSITVNASNPNYCYSDNVLFDKTKTTLVQCPGGKTGAFSIPGSVKYIGDHAFDGCLYITGVTIPDTVISIGDSAFFRCQALASAILPSSINSIGSSAFQYCYALNSITIPANVTSIGYAAFLACTSMSSITVSPDNANYSSVDGVLFNKNQTTLIQFPAVKSGAFSIPDNVAKIMTYAFYASKGLTSVNIPASVTSIGNYAFDTCKSLASAYFYGIAPTMGTNVFDQCASGFTVYYLATNTGFETPTWLGYPCKVFTPFSTTTTSKSGGGSSGDGGTSGGGGTPATTTASSTTTTVGDNSTTTTTEWCPSQKVLGEDNPDLEKLRAFRDSTLAQSAVGRRIINIYYTNAESINAALDRSPLLQAAARKALEGIAVVVGR